MRVKLIEWEKAHGFKSKYVAEKIGVSDSTWSKIKQGKQKPTFEQAERLKEVFGIKNVFDLLKEE